MLDLDRWNLITGWLSREEAQYLYDAVGRSPAGLVVEIGTYHGRSATALLQGCLDFGNHHLHSIDPIDLNDAREAIRGYDPQLLDLWAPIAQRSEDWFEGWFVEEREQVSLFFIDGDHDRVDKDLVSAWIQLKPGGIIICHDYGEVNSITMAIEGTGLPGRPIGAGTSFWEVARG